MAADRIGAGRSGWRPIGSGRSGDSSTPAPNPAANRIGSPPHRVAANRIAGRQRALGGHCGEKAAASVGVTYKLRGRVYFDNERGVVDESRIHLRVDGEGFALANTYAIKTVPP